MDPVLASFLLYFLFITFPLIPAVLIYKIFPDTQVGATGLLGNLKINATGAFAAYIIVSVMSFFVVQYVQSTITGSSTQTWTVNAKMEFVDSNGKIINTGKQKLVDMTKISITPDQFIRKTPDLVKFMATGEGTNLTISFQQENFEGPSIDLSQTDSSIKIDVQKKTIQLGKIVMRQVDQSYTPTATKALTVADTVSGPPIQ